MKHLFATEESRIFAQPRAMIIKCLPFQDNSEVHNADTSYYFSSWYVILIQKCSFVQKSGGWTGEKLKQERSATWIYHG